MIRTTSVAVTVVVVIGIAAGTPAIGSAGATPAATTVSPQVLDHHEENATGNGSVAPGERLHAVVGARGAELDGELERRTFEVKLDHARTENATAAVVQSQFTSIQQRHRQLARQKQMLERAKKNGSIRPGKYQARITVLAVQVQTVTRLADTGEARATELPPGVRERKGISTDAFRRLRADAAALSGPEVAAIARSMAGPGVGQFSHGPSARGPGSGSSGGNASESARGQPGGPGVPGPAGNATASSNQTKESGYEPGPTSSPGNNNKRNDTTENKP